MNLEPPDFVVIRRSLSAHAGDESGILQLLLVCLAGVLHAFVAMVDRTSAAYVE
jgi:hypothetical protein